MRIAIADVQVPFIQGGAEALRESLVACLRARAHEIEVVTMPFRFGPVTEVRRAMRGWAAEDFGGWNGQHADLVICLRFPSYYLSHPNKIVWLVHQHRPAYDLWKTKWDGGLSADPDGSELRKEIVRADEAAFRSCRSIHTISHRVSQRLREYNGVEAGVLHPPSRLAPLLRRGASEPFVFFPSRLESLKRQELLVEAMRYVRSPVVALLAGDGGCRSELERMIAAHDLGDRVRLLGWVDDETMAACYARCLAVVFTPRDEDYGFVVAEAMAAAKPVVTCQDSGEPGSIVRDGETGMVVPPDARAVAEAIDGLAGDATRAERLGAAGHAWLGRLDLSWDRIASTLLGSDEGSGR